MPARKILVVDDEPEVRKLMEHFLTTKGYEVRLAENGRVGLAALDTFTPDLVLLDMHMPEMDGALCCAVMKGDPALHGIPVIMVTSAGKEEDIRLCRGAGCDDFITKPVNRRIFLEKGRKFLDRIDRREGRIPCRTSVKFRAHNVHFSGVSVDISSGGIFVATDFDIEPKTQIELSFELPETGCPLEGIRGQVAWQNSGRNIPKPHLPPGFGVEFINLTKEATETIKSFVETIRQEP